MSKPSLHFFLFGKRSTNSRRGISPVIATTIILAITITLGLALWGFANSGVGTATVRYSETVDRYGDFVNDRFGIVNADFDNPSTGSFAFWVFNSGKLTTTINEVLVICRDAGCTSPTPDLPTLCQHDPDNPTLCLENGGERVYDVPTKELRKFSISASGLQSGKTYEITIVSDNGAAQTFIKKSD